MNAIEVHEEKKAHPGLWLIRIRKAGPLPMGHQDLASWWVPAKPPETMQTVLDRHPEIWRRWTELKAANPTAELYLNLN